MKLHKLFIKILSLNLIIAIELMSLSGISDTFAYFNDTQNVSSNTISTVTLDFSLSSPANFSPDLNQSQTTSNQTINISNHGSLGFQYKAEVESPIGDLCSYLQLIDNLPGSTPQPLLSFASNNATFSAKPNLIFTSSSSSFDESLQGTVCDFKLVFNGWQENIANYGDGGFSDTEEIGTTIKMEYWEPPVVLNEFLPNAGNYPEFVEIFNKTGDPIELDGFYIKANDNTIPINTTTTNTYSLGLTTIPANGWLVVTTSGDQIDDSSGTIVLYNPNHVEVDSYTYEASKHNVNNTPNWTNNLAGYWPFDNDFEDKSGNDNNGTNYGATSVSGKINQALSFDGVDDYMSIAHSSSLNITNEISIEAWVKIDDIPNTYSAIVSKGNSHPGSYMMHLDEISATTYRICPVFYIGGSYDNWQTGCSNDLDYGEWYHVVVTYDGSTEKTFINSILQNQELRSGPIDSTSDPIEIGHDSRYAIGTRHVQGVIDEVKIYDRVLSTTEILGHYNDVSIPSGTVPVDKSYARIPDGSANWVDPIPTPGWHNQLDQEETITTPDPDVAEFDQELIEGENITEEPDVGLFLEVDKQGDIVPLGEGDDGDEILVQDGLGLETDEVLGEDEESDDGLDEKPEAGDGTDDGTINEEPAGEIISEDVEDIGEDDDEGVGANDGNDDAINEMPQDEAGQAEDAAGEDVGGGGESEGDAGGDTPADVPSDESSQGAEQSEGADNGGGDSVGADAGVGEGDAGGTDNGVDTAPAGNDGASAEE